MQRVKVRCIKKRKKGRRESQILSDSKHKEVHRTKSQGFRETGIQISGDQRQEIQDRVIGHKSLTNRDNRSHHCQIVKLVERSMREYVTNLASPVSNATRRGIMPPSAK